MKIRQDWREKLSKIVEGKIAEGASKAGLSKASKLNATYLRDILERHQTPELKNAEKLSDGLGVSITDWFLEAMPSPPPPERKDAIPFGDGRIAPREWPTDIEMRGTAACGKDGLFEFNGEVTEHVVRPPRLVGVPKAYALRVVNDSMIPWRRPGAVVYVHPGLKPQIGDYVVVELKPDKEEIDPIPAAYIKQLLRQNTQMVTLFQHNPEKELPIPAARIKHMHRILELDELFGI